MPDTIVLQSHRQPLPYAWLQECIQSVQSWAGQNQFDYHFIYDELFDPLSPDIMEKTRQQKVIATDLARLIALQTYLAKGYKTVVWCDADFLIFDAGKFKLPASSYSVGREVWVQMDKNNKLKAYKKVHNAFLMFRQGNSFLDFYIDTASQLLDLNSGPMPPQFIGPKLLTALHNIIQCPVLETAGMLSPLVLRDVACGSGLALDLFKQNSIKAISAANLCSSLVSDPQLNSLNMPALIHTLTLPDHNLFTN
jgi:hypothetical protein